MDIDDDTPDRSLRSRLMARVAQSHRHERQFRTMRREKPWTRLADGLEAQSLSDGALAQSCVLRMSDGAELPADARFNLMEMVVLEGAVAMGDRVLRSGEALVSPLDPGLKLRAQATHTRIYLRRSDARGALPSPSIFRVLDDAGWEDFCPGVRIRELWNGGEARSVLVRMQPGACVSAHGHGLDEECMMLAGQAFIGDTLLRSGDFQLAPQGSRHGEITTDVGALFHVHGSLDPAAYL